MVALGAAAECEEFNVTGNCLWPATVIESQAALNFELGEKKNWRKATILADCVVSIVCDEDPETKMNGMMVIDDEYLKFVKGLTDEDLKCYRYDADFDPPRLLATKPTKNTGAFTRGDVKRLSDDKKQDANFISSGALKPKL